MTAIKFGDKYYPGSMTIKELASQLEIQNCFSFKVKKESRKEPTAQEILNDC